MDDSGAGLVYEHESDELFRRGLEFLSKDGRLITCGAHAGAVVPLDIIPFFRAQKNVKGSFVYAKEEVESCLDLARRGRIKPVVHSVFPLEAGARGDGAHGTP